MKGKVSVEKVADGTGIFLEGAEFTLFTWNKNSGNYENGKLLGTVSFKDGKVKNRRLIIAS